MSASIRPARSKPLFWGLESLLIPAEAALVIWLSLVALVTVEEVSDLLSSVLYRNSFDDDFSTSNWSKILFSIPFPVPIVLPTEPTAASVDDELLLLFLFLFNDFWCLKNQKGDVGRHVNYHTNIFNLGTSTRNFFIYENLPMMVVMMMVVVVILFSWCRWRILYRYGTINISTDACYIMYALSGICYRFSKAMSGWKIFPFRIIVNIFRCSGSCSFLRHVSSFLQPYNTIVWSNVLSSIDLYNSCCKNCCRF